MENIELALLLLPTALWETIYMVFVSFLFAWILGMPLGALLFVTSSGHINESPKLYKALGTFVNVIRSFPFAILLIALIPFTRFIIGTSLGTSASIIPLTVAAAPFIARMVETSFISVNPSLTQAALMMGSTPWQIVRKVLVPESIPNLISNGTVAIVNLVGYSAMAGLVGGGGLGSVAIQYGYQRFNTFIMFSTVVLLILFVQLIQWVGDRLAGHVLRKRGLL